MTDPSPHRWPGERFGLPERGPRSVARFGRRLIAIALDWAISYGISWLFFHQRKGDTNPFITLGIFAALQLLVILFFNGSIGHLALRIRLVPVRGGSLAPWRALVRTVLLCLGIPALLGDRDSRGLHDRAAGTLLVRV